MAAFAFTAAMTVYWKFMMTSLQVSRKDEKLQLAKRTGADFTINMSSSKRKYHGGDQQQQQRLLQRAEDIRQEVLEITKGGSM